MTLRFSSHENMSDGSGCSSTIHPCAGRRGLLHAAVAVPVALFATRTLAQGASASVTPATGTSEAAAAYPSRPVRMLVPTPPGTSVDISARLIAEGLRVSLGQPFVVENKPGAGGTIAAAEVARAAADGHTLFYGFNGPMATAPYVFPKVSYKPLEDFAPVIATVSLRHVLVVREGFPARNLREFVAALRAAPGKYNYASVGNASASHLAMERFKESTGTFIVHIPYNGGPGATQGLLAGDVDALFTALVNVQGPVSAGRLRVLGLAEARRSPGLPEVPTFAEQGFAGMEAPLWNAIAAPAATPPALIARLNQAVDQVLAQPETRQKLAAAGMDAMGGSPQQLARLMRNEVDLWLPVIRRLGIKPD